MSQEDLDRLRQNMRAIRNSNQHFKRFSGIPKQDPQKNKEEVKDEKGSFMGSMKDAVNDAEELLIRGRRPERWRRKEDAQDQYTKDTARGQRNRDIEVDGDFSTSDRDPLVENR